MVYQDYYTNTLITKESREIRAHDLKTICAHNKV